MPRLFIRDGRLVLIFDVSVQMYVDKDSTNYPKEGLEKCKNTTCEKFIDFSSNLYAAARVYNID